MIYNATLWHCFVIYNATLVGHCFVIYNATLLWQCFVIYNATLVWHCFVIYNATLVRHCFVIYNATLLWNCFVIKINYVNNVPKYRHASKFDNQNILVRHARANMWRVTYKYIAQHKSTYKNYNMYSSQPDQLQHATELYWHNTSCKEHLT